MINHIGHLKGSTIAATDGEIGRVTGAYFDDKTWTIRYLVVDTGTWLSDRKVLISPYSVLQPLRAERPIAVSLTRQQIMDSPDIDTQKPVSRQHESEYLSYYAYPPYWEGGALWGLAALPQLPLADPQLDLAGARAAAGAAQSGRSGRSDGGDDAGDTAVGDVHLRSSSEVIGYDIQASDDSIGHVKDLVFDDESWAIRYFVVDTRNWLPGGRKVLIGTHWIEQIDWPTRAVRVALTREQVRNSPQFEELEPVTREYENRLHEAYKRQGYWL